MNEYMKMLKQLEFRKQTEEAKFEAFALMCEKVADLEKEKCELLGIIQAKDKEIKELYKEIKKND